MAAGTVSGKGQPVPAACLSRVRSITAGGGTLAQYTYLGAGTVIKVSHPQVAGSLDLAYGTAGVYPGLDQFGRVVDQKWTMGGAIVDDCQYSYDRDSNRIGRINSMHTSFSEAYAYDGLNRLTTANRGMLNAAHTAVAATMLRQNGSLDTLGNWAVL